MKIAVFDPIGNWGGGSRVVRALLPAIKKKKPSIDITYYGNIVTINREKFPLIFFPENINIKELISTRLSSKGICGIHKSDEVVRIIQKKINKFSSILPLYLSGNVLKEIEKESKKFDLAFFPWIFLIPYPNINIPSVAVFHDFNFKYYFSSKLTYTNEQLDHLETEIPRWVEHSNPIVSSCFIKNEINRFYPESLGKVRQIYLGPMSSVSNFSNEQAMNIIRKMKINKKYLLYPTNTCSHKNIGPLLIAMKMIKEKGHDICLVFTGPGTDMINGNSCDIGLELNKKHDRDIIGLGYVSNDEMDALVQCAAIVISTSLYEAGNGPGFDAWHKGVPVAMSKIPPFIEHINIHGLEAGLFNANEPVSISSTIDKMLTDYDKSLKMAASSKKKMQKLSWEKTAVDYIQVFEKAVEDNIE